MFASVYGSVALQSPEDRKRIKGIIVNKFRGDLRLFESGVKMMEEICGIPVLGVIPYYHDIYIEEEDSVELSLKQRKAVQGKVNVAVVLLRHLSNFTDFNMLEHDERVNLYYTNNVDDLMKADIILLPGSKSTIDDLYELRRNGVAQAILQARRNGATVMGICGGYQMMGQRIATLTEWKEVSARCPDWDFCYRNGHRRREGDTSGTFCFPVFRRTDLHGIRNPHGAHFGGGRRDFDSTGTFGERRNGWLCGKPEMCRLLHSRILDNPEVIEWLLAPYAEKLDQPQLDYAAFKEEQYNKLADHVRKHLNMPLLYQILTQND